MVDVKAIKDASNAVRDLKNWLFVFAKEYDIPQEAVEMLHKKVDEVAVKIGSIDGKAKVIK